MNVSSGTGSPGLSRTKGHKMVVVVVLLFCAALCATVVHSAMHTHMNRPNSCVLVRFNFLWLFCVLQFICVRSSFLGLFCAIVCVCMLLLC